MGLFDRLFGRHDSGEGDARLQAAIDRVIESADPRLKGMSEARARLTPAVAHALGFVAKVVADFPPAVAMTPATWSQQPLLRAMFVRPVDVAATLSASPDLRDYLASPQAAGVDTIHCAVAATCSERTVLGHAMEGEMLRQDVAQKTIGFSDFRLLGCASSEDELRRAVEDVVLEGLVMAALRDLAENRERSDMLEAHRQLLLARARLMAQSGAGLETVEPGGAAGAASDREQLRAALADNEARLATLKTSPGVLYWVVDSLQRAESIMQPRRVTLNLNAMNVVVGEEASDAQRIALTEFSTPNPERPRRVAFFASFPRQAVVVRHLDADAVLRSL